MFLILLPKESWKGVELNEYGKEVTDLFVDMK